MTNINSLKKNKSLINPENTVVFLPIFISLLLSSVLIGGVILPLFNKLSNEKSKIKNLEDKILLLPIYKKYIKDITFIISKVNSQQNRLINMISDPNELNTLLSEINEIALKNNIEIVKVKPKDVIKYTSENSIANTKEQLNSNDPLIISNIQKHTHEIKLIGYYKNIVDFLKDLESLQTIVITNNIKIEKARKQRFNNSKTQAKKLSVTFELGSYAYIK